MSARFMTCVSSAIERHECMFHDLRQQLRHERAEHVTMVAAEIVAVVGGCDTAASPAPRNPTT